MHQIFSFLHAPESVSSDRTCCPLKVFLEDYTRDCAGRIWLLLATPPPPSLVTMSAILSADDLNDFISPGVACIKPIETLPVKEESSV